MKNTHNYNLSTLQARTAVAVVMASQAIMDSREKIEKEGKGLIWKLMHDFPAQYTEEIKPVLTAFILAKLAKKAIDEKTIDISVFLALYADLKKEHENVMKDYGAFGDLLEVLVRCFFVGNFNLLKSSHLFVKGFGKLDLSSGKFGKIEIGHNGKTWASATLYDYMAGDFDSVCYGVFNDRDKEKVYNACLNHDFQKVFSIIGKRVCYWSNKYDYLRDMDSLSRGKGLTVKSGCVMNQFNESKYYAFLNAIDEKKFITLETLLRR